MSKSAEDATKRLKSVFCPQKSAVRGVLRVQNDLIAMEINHLPRAAPVPRVPRDCHLRTIFVRNILIEGRPRGTFLLDVARERHLFLRISTPPRCSAIDFPVFYPLIPIF